MTARRLEVLCLGDVPGARLVVIGVGVLAALAAARLMVIIHPLVVLAAAVSGVAGIAVLRSAWMGMFTLLGVIALLPFGTIPARVGFEPTFYDGALLAVYVVLALRVATRRQGWHWPPLSPLVAVFMALALVAFVGGMAHSMPDKTAMRRFAELELGIVLYFVVPNALTGLGGPQRLTGLLAWLGTLAAALGVGLYVLPEAVQVRLLSLLRVVGYPSGPGVVRYIRDDPALAQRATGTSADPNVFGGLLVFGLAVAIGLLAARRWGRDQIPLALACGLMLVCLILTFSRGALVGLAAAAVFIALIRDRRLSLAILCAGGLMLVLPWTQSYVNHFIEGLRGQDLATRMRFGEYKDALILIGRYPWFGVGFADPRDIDLYRGVSSLYLIIAESMGLVGLIAFLAVVGSFIVRMVRALRTPVRGRASAALVGATAAVIGALVSGIFDHYVFTYPHATGLFWLTLGLGEAAQATTRTSSGAPLKDAQQS